jgi:hypothetical protein
MPYHPKTKRLFLWPAEVNFAGASDGGDEGWFESAGEVAHFRQSEFEGSRHVLAGHVAGGEDEFVDGVFC